MANLHTQLQEHFPEAVLQTHAHQGDETVLIKKDSLVEVAVFLKKDPAFDMNVLMDLTAVDGLDLKWNPRFQVVYHFYSIAKNHRLRVKAGVEEKDPAIVTLTGLWPSANWFEREVWDMFGIRFQGHPDLRRILMYEQFQGHALRKDYPWNKRQPIVSARTPS